MKNLSHEFLFVSIVILVAFSYVQGVVVPNATSKYALQAAVINSLDSSSVTVKSLCNPAITKCGKIRITVNTVPDSYQDISFTHNVMGYQNFILDDDQTLQNPSAIQESKILIAADAVVHTITQTPLPGYTTAIGCLDSSGGTIIVGNNAFVMINNGENVTCTFTNTPVVPTACTNTWTQKANFGGLARNRAFGFGINGKGYVGAGLAGPPNFQDFWEYNPITNAWTQKANFGGGIGWDNATFVVNGKGYVVTGSDGVWSTNDTWEYNPISNVWIQKTDFGGAARFGAVGFAIGAKGYVGLGNDPITNNGVFLQDFWEYNPVTDIWTQKANFAGGLRHRAEGFSIGNKGYVGVGYNSVGGSWQLFQDFWEYNPVTDIWTQKANFPGSPRWDAASFSIGNKGYLGTGRPYQGNYFQDFWEYNPVTDIWTQKAAYGGGPIAWTTSFSVGTKGYISTGLSASGYGQQHYEYCP